MSTDDTAMDGSAVTRREALQYLGTISATASLAGCTDENNPEQGERVPTIDYTFYNGAVPQDTAPVVESSMQELGLDINMSPAEWASVTESVYNDARDEHIWHAISTARPSRLDPQEFMMRWTAMRAGANNRPNLTNYANCEYTNHAMAQSFAGNDRDRRYHVYEAQQIMGEDYAIIPMNHMLSFGAYRSGLVDASGLGQKGLGVIAYNHQFVCESTPTEGDSLVLGQWGTLRQESLQLNTATGSQQHSSWNNIPLSGLFEYDEEWNLRGSLAEDEYEWSNNGQQVEITLRDALFHNGDPITSEDVKFSFEHFEEHVGSYPVAIEQNYEAIRTPDDTTVIFEFQDPKPSFITTYASVIPILNKEWYEQMGADENPDNFDTTPEDFVGSGPFKPTQSGSGSVLFFEPHPHEGHPLYQPDHNLVWQGFSDREPMINAFIEGNVHTIESYNLGHLEQIRDELEDNQWEEANLVNFTPDYLCPQCSFGPFKFKEMRQAVGMAINRERQNALAYDGRSEEWLHASPYGSTHPWLPPEEYLTYFTDDPSGDLEGAKQVLEDAGWQQDDNGNWHYPQDANLDPEWPEGEEPDPEEFPCISSEGEWNQPDGFEVGAPDDFSVE